jgi:hypothetical protein
LFEAPGVEAISEWALFRSCLGEDMWLLHDLELSTGMRWSDQPADDLPDRGVGYDGDHVPGHHTRDMPVPPRRK